MHRVRHAAARLLVRRAAALAAWPGLSGHRAGR